MEYEFRKGKLFVSRASEKREPILQRLRRIEGQMRGLIGMVGTDRYCLEEVQQANAITSAMREVALLILTSHLDAGIDFAIRSGRQDGVMPELSVVLRTALKLQSSWSYHPGSSKWERPSTSTILHNNSEPM